MNDPRLETGVHVQMLEVGCRVSGFERGERQEDESDGESTRDRHAAVKEERSRRQVDHERYRLDGAPAVPLQRFAGVERKRESTTAPFAKTESGGRGLSSLVHVVAHMSCASFTRAEQRSGHRDWLYLGGCSAAFYIRIDDGEKKYNRAAKAPLKRSASEHTYLRDDSLPAHTSFDGSGAELESHADLPRDVT